MLRQIIQQDNSLLRQVSENVDTRELPGVRITRLKQDLLDTLDSYSVGVAISAVQIGEPVQLFVIHIKADPDRPQVRPVGPLFCFNPTITWVSEKLADKYEACLSIEHGKLYGQVTRPADIRLSYIDEAGVQQETKYTGFLSRIVQHEMDHLQGKLFTDLATADSLMSEAEYIKLRQNALHKSDKDVS